MKVFFVDKYFFTSLVLVSQNILNLQLLKIGMSVMNIQEGTRDRTEDIKFYLNFSLSNDTLQQLFSFGLCVLNIFCSSKKNTFKSKGPVTCCYSSCNLQCNSTFERC